MTPQQLWQAALGELELLLSKANFTTWFKHTAVSSFENGRVTISIPNNFTKTWLEKKYHQTILKALKSVTDNEAREVIYKIEPLAGHNQPTAIKEIIGGNDAEAGIEKNIETREKIKTPVNIFGLNPRYTFNNFIVGKNNELAHAAALAVAKNPGHAYNPLFIYGGVGLGKTHLLQAIGQKIVNDNPKAKILYVSCEKFTNDYIAAVQNGTANEFEKKYRSIDVLLVDDIQFLAGKERTQEAFFHTFNELHQLNKQIIISSDRPPKAIASLEHRLISRFEWGMIADISAPDLEIKIAITEAKAKEKNFPLTSEAANYLATVVHNNIRELEGALNRIIAHSQLQNRELSLEEIKQITAAITANSRQQSLTPKHIIQTVAEYFDISIGDINSACRKKNLAEPRQIIMFLMREEISSSYPTIGQALGGRDHTTAIHAYEKISRQIKVDDKLRQDIMVLKQRLYNS